MIPGILSVLQKDSNKHTRQLVCLIIPIMTPATDTAPQYITYIEEVFLCERAHSSLDLFILVEAASIRTIGVDTTSWLKLILVILTCAVDILFENRVRLDVLKLGLEVLESSCVAAAVGATAGVVHGEA